MHEEWRDVPGYEGRYRVSNLGRVKTIRKEEKLMRSDRLNSKGYPFVSLYKNGTKFTGLVHRLVALSFLGPSKLEVNHIDGVKTNNRLDNLEYCTSSENQIHAITKFNIGRGERNGFAKLTKEQAISIKRLLRQGHNQKDIASQYNVTSQCIYAIAKGITWNWVE